MTAYLQPGDRIVVALPGTVVGGERDQEIADIVKRIYREMDIEVTFVIMIAPGQQAFVVSVTRPDTLPRGSKAVGAPMDGEEQFGL